MKVLTLWQPWASLVALGVKHIETRGWSTRYRGPLAIHAAARRPDHGQRLGPQTPMVTEEYLVDGPLLLELCNQERHPLSLGAIVATGTLVDVVPIKPYTTFSGARPYLMVAHDGSAIWLDTPDGKSTGVTDQIPYGDFTPGRFAWILADVAPVDPPVPFRGGQRLTRTWEP